MPVQSIVSEAQRSLSTILRPLCDESKQNSNVKSARKAVKTYTVEDISLLLPSKLKCKESENTANPASLPEATVTKGKVKVVENLPQPITFLRGSNFHEVYTFGRVSCEVEDSPAISLQDLFNDGFECSTNRSPSVQHNQQEGRNSQLYANCTFKSKHSMAFRFLARWRTKPQVSQLSSLLVFALRFTLFWLMVRRRKSWKASRKVSFAETYAMLLTATCY